MKIPGVRMVRGMLDCLKLNHMILPIFLDILKLFSILFGKISRLCLLLDYRSPESEVGA